ncbi:hypothetical protein LZZ85_04770 [Terrimonas sp. NA20]|uniref:Holin n=1 Tax=Terrimonas ginsenosidimutans TaxID=2908004 RepID=A0ABS9KMN0_9BACT|nr:hypothetical protein [Terrimonas ginsenosidimutans]MCG2613578.1 hypothetical protein [Terrimonas ginsenosidimutans]
MKPFFQRLQQDTPPFFRTLRNIGLCLAAAGTTIVAAPIELPSFIVTIANYLIVAGSVASAISQATVMEEDK